MPNVVKIISGRIVWMSKTLLALFLSTVSKQLLLYLACVCYDLYSFWRSLWSVMSKWIFIKIWTTYHFSPFEKVYNILCKLFHHHKVMVLNSDL